MSAQLINQEKGLIFRITHRMNIAWIAENGLHCATSDVRDPNFIPIGNAELIGRRRYKALPEPFEGTLGDHIPFYFTPFSPMMYNIHTGYGGVDRQRNEDIVILVSSIARLALHNVPFVFSDRHAYLDWARFSDDPEDLNWIDWTMLAARDFKRDPNDPGKFEKYEAEALIRTHLPVEGMIGVACYNNAVTAEVAEELTSAGAEVQARARPGWYF